MLLKARTEQLITQEEIVEMLYVIFGAGMETTASSLSSMIYCLAAYPEWQETLYQEIETLDEHQPKFLKSLVKMPLFMKEVFRLYPPIWAQARGVNDQDYSLNNQYILPKNSLILMLPYFSQRSSTYWTNPQKFDPNRFDANYREQYPIDKAAHLIHFSYGKDDCIGRFFAEDLIKSFLVQLIKFYTLKTHAEAKPKQGPLAMYLDPLKIEIIPRSFED